MVPHSNSDFQTVYRAYRGTHMMLSDRTVQTHFQVMQTTLALYHPGTWRRLKRKKMWNAMPVPSHWSILSTGAMSALCIDRAQWAGVHYEIAVILSQCL